MSRRIELVVHHNMELAHRLFTLPGKCQNIHGHGMKVSLGLLAEMDSYGYAIALDGTPIEFGNVKKTFRAYIDEVFDHHLHLNQDDPWASELVFQSGIEAGRLPGLQIWPGDPSTENFAVWIYEAMQKTFNFTILNVEIAETGTNGVTYVGGI